MVKSDSLFYFKPIITDFLSIFAVSYTHLDVYKRQMKYNTMVDILDEINKAKIDKRYSFMKMEDIDIEIVKRAEG